jgi:hypothetical protein
MFRPFPAPARCRNAVITVLRHHRSSGRGVDGITCTHRRSRGGLPRGGRGRRHACGQVSRQVTHSLWTPTLATRLGNPPAKPIAAASAAPVPCLSPGIPCILRVARTGPAKMPPGPAIRRQARYPQVIHRLLRPADAAIAAWAIIPVGLGWILLTARLGKGLTEGACGAPSMPARRRPQG